MPNVTYNLTTQVFELELPGPTGMLQRVAFTDNESGLAGLRSVLVEAAKHPNAQLGTPARPVQSGISATLLAAINEKCDRERAERRAAAEALLAEIGL